LGSPTCCPSSGAVDLWCWALFLPAVHRAKISTPRLWFAPLILHPTAHADRSHGHPRACEANQPFDRVHRVTDCAIGISEPLGWTFPDFKVDPQEPRACNGVLLWATPWLFVSTHTRSILHQLRRIPLDESEYAFLCTGRFTTHLVPRAHGHALCTWSLIVGFTV
jgi:hypothetical protein